MLVERKKRGNKKNKLEEIQKPRGYDRGYELSRIVGTTDCTNVLMFLVQWDTCDELDLLLASEVNEKSPQAVIAFYEQRCPIYAKCEKRKQRQEQYDSDLLEHPPADDVIEVEAEVTNTTIEDDAIEVDESAAVATETNSDVIMANISTVTDTTLNESVSIAGLTETDMSTSDFSARIDEADSTLPPPDGPPEQLMITPQKENQNDDCEVIPEDIEIPNIDDY